MTVKVEDKRLFGPDGNPIERDAPDPAAGPEPLPPAPDFSQLVLSLHASALMSMGWSPGEKDPVIPRDLGAAKQTIDLLEMLSKKTSGNLTSEEEGLLQESLTALRLLFVREWEKP